MKNKLHSQKNYTFGVKSKKSNRGGGRGRERESACVSDSVLHNGYLSLTGSEGSCSPPTSLSLLTLQGGVSVCLSECEFVLQRESGGGGMLCSLHLSGGQEWTGLPVALFHPRGCTRAVNGMDVEPHVPAREYQCLFITCKISKAHDPHSNNSGHFPKFYSNPTDKTSLLEMVRDKMCGFIWKSESGSLSLACTLQP